MADSTLRPVKVKLESPLLNIPGAHEVIHIEDHYGNDLKISLHRTIRVPDNGQS